MGDNNGVVTPCPSHLMVCLFLSLLSALSVLLSFTLRRTSDSSGQTDSTDTWAEGGWGESHYSQNGCTSYTCQHPTQQNDSSQYYSFVCVVCVHTHQFTNRLCAFDTEKLLSRLKGNTILCHQPSLLCVGAIGGR